MNITREKMNYDLVIVGAGPSGLSAAINFKFTPIFILPFFPPAAKMNFDGDLNRVNRI